MEALLTLDEKKRRQRFYKNRESFDNFSVKPMASIPRPIIPGNLSKFFKIVKMPSKSGNNRSSGCSSGTSRGTSSGISKGNSSCTSSAATSGKYVIRSNACRRSGGSTSATKSSNLQRIPVSHIGFEFTSNKKNAEKRQQHIVDYNRYDRCKLRKMKALVNTGRVASRPKVSLLEKYELPQETREKYAQIVRPMNDIELKRMMRPKIYYYLEVKDLRPLGRIVIQLFTEACPEVVLEFVRMCMEHNTKMIEFTRLFPLLWIEGELYFKRQTLVESNFEYDMQVMDHGYGPGILSFPKRFCDTGFRNGSINFTLSFMPLALANENRVVFGVVTRGLKVLEALPDYGCTSGKLKKEIIRVQSRVQARSKFIKIKAKIEASMAGDRLGTSAQRMPNFSDSKNNQRAYYVDMHDVEDSADYDEGRLKNSSAFFFPSDVETNSKTNPISKIYHDDDDLDDDDDDDNGIDDDPIKSKETSDESLKSQVSVLQKKVIFQKYTHLDKKLLKKENDILFAKLKSVKNKVVSRHIDDSKNKAQRMQKFRIPQHTLVKYQQFIKTPRPRILRKLIRPKIFLDLEGKNVRPLGRICIQLFTEACPEVVLEFVRMGMDRNAQRMDITRIYPGLCIESELHFTQKVLNEPLFEYDMTVMDHGFSYGILSFAKCYLAGFKTGVLNFSISFKPLSVLNGERIVFGIVTRGLKVIDMLEDYGTSNGRLLQNVRVTKCGMLK